jgi:glycosyltransferase involved in cell wall biosynthesis
VDASQEAKDSTPGPLRYAAVTPARNEADHLPRLAECLARQTVRPTAWVVVDNGSTDRTLEVAQEVAASHDWVRVVSAPGAPGMVRGGPVIRAFNAGLAVLDDVPDVVVKLDADVSFDPDHFERLLAEFAADPALGISSGACWELEGGVWTERFTTRAAPRGAVRAYRRECLEAVSPLEETMGWDGIDELKANLRGWRTRVVRELGFRHHRRVGERDGSRRAAWEAEGKLAHYMGYRPGYLLVRASYRAVREPAALAMVWAYARAALRGERRCADEAARAHLRTQQRLRQLPLRAREALGRRTASRLVSQAARRVGDA